MVMANVPRGKYITLLRCGHTAHYDPEPKPGDEVYCRRCGNYTKVKTAHQEYSWHCPVCHTSRPFGADKDAAYAAARRHQRKYHHVVSVRQGYTQVGVVGPEGEQELSVSAERIQWVRQHQGGLRALVDRQIVQGGQSTKDRSKTVT